MAAVLPGTAGRGAGGNGGEGRRCPCVPARVRVRAYMFAHACVCAWGGAGSRVHVCPGERAGVCGGAATGCRFSCPPVGAARAPSPSRGLAGGPGLPDPRTPLLPRAAWSPQAVRERGWVRAQPPRRSVRAEPPARRPPLLPLLRSRSPPRGSSPLREGRAARGEPRNSPGQSGVSAGYSEGGTRRGSAAPALPGRAKRRPAAPGMFPAALGAAAAVSAAAMAASPRVPSAGLSLGAAPEHPPGTPASSRPAGAWGGSAGRRGHAGGPPTPGERFLTLLLQGDGERELFYI